jgi:hypothetical protein
MMNQSEHESRWMEDEKRNRMEATIWYEKIGALAKQRHCVPFSSICTLRSRGISIDWNDKYETESDLIRNDRFQMKLMKVMYNSKNKSIQDLQHFLEVAFIEMLRIKIRWILFDWIVVDWIENKSVCYSSTTESSKNFNDWQCGSTVSLGHGRSQLSRRWICSNQCRTIDSLNIAWNLNGFKWWVWKWIWCRSNPDRPARSQYTSFRRSRELVSAFVGAVLIEVIPGFVYFPDKGFRCFGAKFSWLLIMIQ